MKAAGLSFHVARVLTATAHGVCWSRAASKRAGGEGVGEVGGGAVAAVEKRKKRTFSRLSPARRSGGACSDGVVCTREGEMELGSPSSQGGERGRTLPPMGVVFFFFFFFRHISFFPPAPRCFAWRVPRTHTHTHAHAQRVDACDRAPARQPPAAPPSVAPSRCPPDTPDGRRRPPRRRVAAGGHRGRGGRGGRKRREGG